MRSDNVEAQPARSRGKRRDDPALAKGWFIEATVFAHVTPDMRIFREEICGPYCRSRDGATRISSSRTSTASSMAGPHQSTRAISHRLARRVQAGYVWINTSSANYVATHFGGHKKSALGPEEGSTSCSRTQVKNVHAALQYVAAYSRRAGSMSRSRRCSALRTVATFGLFPRMSTSR